MNLPEKFQKEMIRILGEEGFREYLDSFEKPRVYGLRVNTSKISVEDFLKISPWELKTIPWITNGFYYDGDHISPAKHPYYYAGLYYLQEPSAMTPANLLPVAAGDRILDVCAAPGGKSTELGAKLQNANISAGIDRNKGVLITNDISSSRARGLLKNVEVFGLGNALVLCEDPVRLTPRFKEYFDKILIDAPCSGEGMFRKEHKMIRAWEEHGPEFFGKLQRSITEEAVQMLKPGGMMLYSTCTFSAHENEGTICDLLKNHPEMHVADAALYPGGSYEGFGHGIPELIPDCPEELKGAIRIWPHRMQGEGHFICLLQKEALEAAPTLLRKNRNTSIRSIPDELTGFLDPVSIEWKKECFDLRGDQVYYMPEELPDLKGCRFLRSGLYLGDLKKGRFEPSQAFAMFLKQEEAVRTLTLTANDPRTVKYLKGETIEITDADDVAGKGYVLVLLEGYPLGWGKINGCNLKNKYLPGWRMSYEYAV